MCFWTFCLRLYTRYLIALHENFGILTAELLIAFVFCRRTYKYVLKLHAHAKTAFNKMFFYTMCLFYSVKYSPDIPIKLSVKESRRTWFKGLGALLYISNNIWNIHYT